MHRRRLLTAAVLLVPLPAFACGDDADGGTVAPAHTPTATTQPATNAPSPTAVQDTATPTTEPPTAMPTREPGSGATMVECHDMLAPVDKDHRLPSDCVPNDLVTLPASVSYSGEQLMTSESADALLLMLSDAADEGYEIFARSTYRSYQTQVSTYQYHVDALGQAQADRVSARPGHSEHQLGTTVDLTTAEVGYELSESLGDTDAGIWLAETSWKYGFILSYAEGTEGITGYAYEPWHFRYVGVDVARDVRQSGLTLHEFLLR